jgi:hypothetical protein
MEIHEVDKEVKELLMEGEEILLPQNKQKEFLEDRLVHLIPYMLPIFV